MGLSIIELAMGCYPYPPETYSNVFAQLQAIVHGPPPRLPEGYSDVAQDFVAQWFVPFITNGYLVADLIAPSVCKRNQKSDGPMLSCWSILG